MEEEVIKPICGICTSKYVYVKADGSIKCRRCGRLTIPKKKEEELDA